MLLVLHATLRRVSALGRIVLLVALRRASSVRLWWQPRSAVETAVELVQTHLLRVLRIASLLRGRTLLVILLSRHRRR